jgi:pimeloyl-ACP methyl ester carboxylesterase
VLDTRSYSSCRELTPASFGGLRCLSGRHTFESSHQILAASDGRYPGGAISYELLAEDALAFIRTLGLRKPLICGFADGACVALQMAIWEPELAAAYVFM